MQKLSDVSDKRIKIIHQNGQSVSGPMAPKKGIVFSLFNFSRVQTSGQNTTTVLSKPVPETPHPHVPRADLTAIKNWVGLEEKIVHEARRKAQSEGAVFSVKTPRPNIIPRADFKAVESWIALEEKVVHDYREQKRAEPKGAVSSVKTPRPSIFAAIKGLVVPERKVVRDTAGQKKVQPQSAVPSPKTPRQDLPRTDLAAIENWVALEEKIIHDYKEQKKAQPKSVVSLPKTPRPDLLRTGLAAFRDWISSSEKVVRSYKEQKTAQPESVVPLPKTPRPDLLRVDLAAIKSQVSREEKIVRDYGEQKKLQPQIVISPPKTLEKQPPPVFENFSMRTIALPSPQISKLEEPFREPEKTFLWVGKILLVLGWLTAAAFVLLYVQETFLNREVSQRLSQVKSEKNLLENSYVALRNVLEDQRTEMSWLNGELQDTTSELKTARSETHTLQNTVQTQKAIIAALKAQTQAFEKIIDQGGVSALSGAAAGFSREQFSTGRTSVFQGEVTSINERRGFVVISMGAAQGAHLGRWISISRNDRGLAVGRIDRVYPTMSVAVLRNAGMLRMIQEGDSVFFS